MIDEITVLNNLPNFDNNFKDTHLYIWAKDKKGKYLSCNKTMYNDVGLSNESEILGLTDLELCWEKFAILFRGNDNIIMHGRESQFFIETTKIADGRKFKYYSYKAPLYVNSKKVLGTIGFGFSLTQLDSHLQKNLNSLSFISPREQQKFQNLPYSFSFFLTSQKIRNIHLSVREIECIKLTVRGKTAKEIANLLNISYRTVESYLENIKSKLKINSKRELIDLVMQAIFEK